eukprot:3957774-Amphidinium_carterae.1
MWPVVISYSSSSSTLCNLLEAAAILEPESRQRSWSLLTPSNPADNPPPRGTALYSAGAQCQHVGTPSG